jgi:exodeoxyribonuclease VII large subunit
MAEIKRTHNQETLSVSALSQHLKRAVEDQFGYVRVQGEISSFKVHTSSGHAYFKLKDENAVLDGVCWRGVMGKIPFRPEDGMEVVCAGKITTYPARSNYQLVVEFMEPAGIGAMMALLEQRKKQLAAEGLFDPARKQLIPFLPRVIGVVTSPTGAVIRDILHRISDRFPVHVIVWPVLVQGEGAAEQIAAAIRGFNQLPAGSFPPSDGSSSGQSERSELAGGATAEPERGKRFPPQTIPRPDLLIVARGGGSLEDLWAFNEEIVVRAAAESDIPLISAVGHETDTTLIDFASDHRAPTPTAAAEKAVPVREELLGAIARLSHRKTTAWSRRMTQYRDRVEGLARGLPNPQQLIEYSAQRLDDWSDRLRSALPVFLDKKQQRVMASAALLTPKVLSQQIMHEGQKILQFHERAHRALERRLESASQKLDAQSKLLASLNYQSVLSRGFALVRDASGALVSSASDMHPGRAYQVVLRDGEKEVTTN